MGALKLLVTGIGAPGTPGTLWALRHNPDGVPVEIIGTDLDPDAPGRHLCDEFVAGLPPENVDYATKLRDIALRNGTDLIIPQTTRELTMLAQQERTVMDSGLLRRFGAPVMVANLHAVQRANDKPYVYLRGASRPYRPECGWAERLVCKLPNGSGKRGYREIETGGFWMEYLPGPEYSVDCFIGQHVRVAVPRIRHRVKGGVSTDTEVVDLPDLATEALQIGDHLGLTGVYGVQFKESDGGVPKVIDCNPRVMGTMICTVLAGVNLVWMGVQEALGNPPTRAGTARIGTRYQRVWDGTVVA